MVYPQLPSPPPPLGGAAKGRQGFVIAVAVAVIALAAGAGVVIARTNDDSPSAGSSFPDSSSAVDSSVAPSDGTSPRANRDHFHAAYAINICGTEQPPLSDVGASDLHGIHTHGDGLIHIHPFDETVAGNRATLSKFFDQTGVQLTDTALTIPGRGTKAEGRDQCDGKDAELVVLMWASAADADAGRPPDETHTTDMSAVRLRRGEAITIAFRAKDASVSGPSNAVERLMTVGDLAPPTTRGRTTTTTTQPTSTSTA